MMQADQYIETDEPAEETQTVTAEGMIAVTVRLAEILAEEVDLLQEMAIDRVGEIQPEKMRLTETLERYKRILEKNPTLMDTFTEAQENDLRKVTEIFNVVLEENRRQLQVAREVNLHIMEAIADSVIEAQGKPRYNRKGDSQHDESGTAPVTLNDVL